jgi:hypothetical protein
MSSRKQDYINAVNSGERAWNLAFAHPYGEAYEKAFDVFKKALADQAEADKRNAELAVLAASVVTGSLLTAALASTTLMVLARRTGLRAISRNNLHLTYRTARAVGTHPVTVFAVGKLLDEAKSTVRKQLAEVVAKNLAVVPRRLTDSPGSMRSQLQATMTMQALCATDAAEAIEASTLLSESEKDAHFAVLRQAPIVVRPKSAINSETLWPRIALSMFMSHILDLDELVDVPARYHGGSPYAGLGQNLANPEKARPIDLLPSDPRYPRPGMPRPTFGGTPAHQRIGIAQAGGKIVERTNELHGRVLGGAFFVNTGLFSRSTSMTELRKAESVLNELGRRSRPNAPDAVVSL